MNYLEILQRNVSVIKKRSYLQQVVLDAVLMTKLSEGRDSTDSIIGTYSRATEIASLFGEDKPIRPKVEGQPYNYEWTGGLFEGMTLEFTNNSVSWWSTDEKTPFLVEKYDNLLGLDDFNFTNYVLNQLCPIFEKVLCNRIHQI